MEFSVIRHVVNDGVFRLEVTGEVDIEVTELLLAAIDDAVVGRRAAAITVDLCQVTFIDSEGAKALLDGRHIADRHACDYHVTGAKGIVLRTLQTTGVAALLAS